MPAEWEPQRGVLLAWPHGATDWAPMLAAVESCYDRLAAAIAEREPLLVVVADDAHRDHVRHRLQAAGVDTGNVTCHLAPTDDTWVRDYGPLTVHTDAGPRLLDFTFDGWNGRFDARRDDAVTRALWAAGALGDAPLASLATVLEGGAVETDGAGLLLTTPRCLLDRANGLDRAGYEALFRAELGTNRVLWLESGSLTGDDTDGHVDMLARLCPGGVVAHTAPGPADPDAAALRDMAAELAALVAATPGLTALAPLPRPRPLRGDDGGVLPASYANFLVIDGAVLVPCYDDPADAVAAATLADCFPGRAVVGIPARPLIHQHGSVHCATMHLPA